MNKHNTDTLRDALGRFATGVAVVTCSSARGPRGVTANSFSSVSLDPPLVLWNIARVTNSLNAYLDAEYFTINVLASDQQSVSVHFAQTEHTSFDNVDFSMSVRDVPLLAGAIAYFECRTREIHEGGDHYIIVGEVENYRHTSGDPLLFYNGEYAQIRDPD